jgi:hypothetical protein
MDLETRTLRMLESQSPDAASMNSLLFDLAEAKETDALVRIWDLRGRIPGWEVQPEAWAAIIKLHSLGKGKVPDGTIHPPVDRRRLAPSRRLHKICKFKK